MKQVEEGTKSLIINIKKVYQFHTNFCVTITFICHFFKSFIT